MALARVFGVDINGGMMLSMFFSVFVLSVGAPGVPGAGLVCLSVLLTQLNVPLAGIGLVMGLDSLLGMMRAMSNRYEAYQHHCNLQEQVIACFEYIL